MKLKLFILFLLGSFALMSVGAQNNKLKTLEARRKAVAAEIDAANRMLREARVTEKKSLEQINLVSSQLENRKVIISTLNEEIELTAKEINSKEKQVKELDKQLELRKQQYANAMQRMSVRSNREDKLIFVLSGKSLTEVYKRFLYLKQYTEAQKSYGVAIISQRDSIDKVKQLLVKHNSDKEALLSQRQKEENELKLSEQNFKKELAGIQQNQSELQAEIEKKRVQAKSFDREIERLIREEIEREALAEKERQRKEEEMARREEVRKKEVAAKADKTVSSALAASKDSREVEDQVAVREKPSLESSKERLAEASNEPSIQINTGRSTAAVPKIDRALTGSFAQNKGRLPYPVTRSGVIVSYFGLQSAGGYKNLQTENAGIDIKVPEGTEARSVFQGVVSRVFVLPGYNTTVMLRHGDYITIYGNLNEVYVKQGDKVSTKQKLGKIFIQPGSNSTTLHFQIRKETTKLNPSLWLAR